MTPKGQAMQPAVAKLAAFVASDVIAIWAAVTDTTWLAAGTFVVTLGGVVKMLYQMRIDAAKDRFKIDLELATLRIEALKVQNAGQQAEIKGNKDEIQRLRDSQHDIRGAQQSIVNAQAEMKLDLAKKTFSPDPDHPFPVTIVKLPDPPGGRTDV